LQKILSLNSVIAKKVLTETTRIETAAVAGTATTASHWTASDNSAQHSESAPELELLVVDLTSEEQRVPVPRILEGTGCLVLDHIHRVAYVSLSERADGDLALAWGELMGYRVVAFTARDGEGRPIYHTNVMMAVGTSAAVVCLEAVIDRAERHNLFSSLHATGHEVIDISLAQVCEMAGNVLEVMDGSRNLPVLCMSSRAFASLTPKQVTTMKQHWAGIHHAPIPTLEAIGGGSVRCTMAELFLCGA